MKSFRDLLPQFPKTPHLPFHPNVQDDDVVAKDNEIEPLFNASNQIYVEEKLDGASAAIAVIDDHPVIRNREHILNKGFIRKKNDTTAKMQFRPIWNWYYKNKKKFNELYDHIGPVTVYGEWMLAQHGMFYDRLPSYFVAYDLFCHRTKQFLQTSIVRNVLTTSGFALPSLIHTGKISNSDTLESLLHQKSKFSSTEIIEGLYFKFFDGESILRFKMVRENFKQGSLWDHFELKKNLLA